MATNSKDGREFFIISQGGIFRGSGWYTRPTTIADSLSTVIELTRWDKDEVVAAYDAAVKNRSKGFILDKRGGSRWIITRCRMNRFFRK